MAPDVYGLRLLRQPRVQRLALGIVAAVVLAYRALQVAAWTGQIQWGYDFSAYWQAAGNVVAGLPIYSAAQLAGPYSPQQQFLYLYPPPFAAALTPFASFLPADARFVNWAWFGLGLAIVVASVLAIGAVERLGDRFELLRGRGRWWLVTAALALPPVVAELVLGNVHLEILGLLTVAWLGVRRGTRRGDLGAGAAIGVATLIKVFPALLILWLLLTRRYRAAIAAGFAIAAVTLVTLPLTGVQPWLDYPTVLANLGAPVDTKDTLAPTVWLAPILGFGSARLLVTGVGVALIGILGWRARGVTAPSPVLAASFGGAVAASVLIAPAVYQHYLAILVLPLLLGLAAGVRLRWLALSYFLMWGGQQAALGDLAWVVNKGLPTAGAIALLAALVKASIGLAGAANVAPAPAAAAP
jgi:hypothetical protein